MTSAMQIVADLETPTRQWTRVAVFSCLPLSVTNNVSIPFEKGHRRSYE